MVLLWLGLKPKTLEDVEKLGIALQTMLAADSHLAVKTAADGTTD